MQGSPPPIKPGSVDQAIKLWESLVAPVLEQGAYQTGDRNTGKGVVVTLWETEADATAIDTSGTYQQSIAPFAALLAAPPSRAPGAKVESYDGVKYINSGILSRQPPGPDQPPNDRLTVVFTKPGMYKVNCVVHPYMYGMVEVLPANTPAKLKSPAQVVAEAQAEVAAAKARVDMIREQGKAVRSEPGPGNTTIWYVRAGALEPNTGDQHVQTYEYLPKKLTIKAGDTVVWSSPEFHSITFISAPPPPEPIMVRPQEKGPPLFLLNPMVEVPAKPSGVYDPSQYFNSAAIGPLSPNGLAWSLTFDTPRTYKYFCAYHRGQGMEGEIIAQPR